MKVSELCRMIEESIHTEKYPLGDQEQKKFANLVKITNKSESDDLKSEFKIYLF
jgi:7,8-dihydro-6-hydroxymethylpterin-pyrophosphokinase